MARKPWVLTHPERLDKLVKMIEQGNTFKDACRLADIGQSSFFQWLAAGNDAAERAAAGKRLDKKERGYAEFAERVKKAEAEATNRNVLLIAVAARTNWTAAAWWLERRRPNEWGRKDRVISDPKVAFANPDDDLANLSPEQLRERLAKLENELAELRVEDVHE